MDIVELETPEESLRHSEQRYRTLFDSMDEAYCVLEMLFDANGKPIDYRFLETNAAFVSMTGWPHAVGTRMREIAPHHEEHWFATYGKVAVTGEPIRFVQQANILDERWFDLFAFRLGGPESRNVAVLFSDITERRRDRNALALARAELSELIDLAPSFMTVYRGPDFVIEVANDAYQRLAGQRELIGRPVRTAFPEVVGQGFFELIENVYATGQSWVGKDVPLKLQMQPGGPVEQRYIDLVYQALRGADGAITGVFAHGVDITARKRAEDQLRDSDRRKTEFIAMLAHELRNPLAPIRSAVQLLRLTEGSDASAQATFAMMERQLAQMVRLIDDLLDVSRISRGKVELRMQRVELAGIVRQAVEAAQPLFDNMGQSLHLAGLAVPVLLNADPARLSQAIGNLLTNASKFTARGGHVRLDIESDDRAVVLRVSDSGVGIAAEDVGRIFEIFTQLDTSLDRLHGGLGIGLTLVKELIELHGGTVEATSGGSGQGSQFVLRLPVLARQPDSLPAPAQLREAAPVARRVLVVDDNADAAEGLAMLLEFSGHAVSIAHDGLEAVAVAAASCFDVVLLDVGLPRLDGYGVARRIRSMHGSEVLLVAITGWGQEDDRRQARAAGFDAHLTKPVDYDELTRLIATRAVTRRPASSR